MCCKRVCCDKYERKNDLLGMGIADEKGDAILVEW